MNFIQSLWTWIKANMVIAIIILVGVVIVFFPKLLGGLFGRRRVRHHRRTRTLPRSVGMHRARRHVSRPSVHRRGSKVKKPWQVKGSLAAKRHMAQIRRMR